MKEDWIWKHICKEWEHKENCEKDENNIIHLTALVKDIKKMKEHDNDCLFFLQPNISYHGKSVAKNDVCPKSKEFPKDGSFRLTCTGSVDDANVMDLIVEPSVNDSNFTSYPQFWFLFIALSVSWIAMAVIVSVGDAICFHLLGKRHELYGHQRLWGAIGWGSFALLSGFLVDSFSFSVIFYLMTAALLPDTLVSTCLDVSFFLNQYNGHCSNLKKYTNKLFFCSLQFKPNKVSSSIIRDIGRLFRSARVIVFFIWCISIGIFIGVLWNFLFWYLEDLADQNHAGE